uniref:Uncharacterized protein n=1 Tax=Picea sitchensis TaxID=3332 RepID=A0A6B9XUQ7_PICSI|nr:hypothetical protein Q903MT_gene4084 [Picea sitchensis]
MKWGGFARRFKPFLLPLLRVLQGLYLDKLPLSQALEWVLQ